MAKILPFARMDAVPQRNATDGVAAGTGEIVIFPGVRVEYHHDHPTSPKGGPSSRRGRGSGKRALSA